MSQTYAAAMKAALTALRALIVARAAADGISIPDVIISDRAAELTNQPTGVFITRPSRGTPTFGLGGQVRVPVRVPVQCLVKAFDETTASYSLFDVEGVVVDAVNANPSLTNTCVIARAMESEQLVLSEPNLTRYMTTVWLEVEIQHSMT